ncbi:Beta-1,3-galactosyltransferase [Dirofilaria immitis]
MIRLKFFGISILSIIILLWIYDRRKLCNFSIEKEITVSKNEISENSNFQQFSNLFIKGLEFRYAWYKINQYKKNFQPFWYLIEPTVCTKKKHATILLYLAVTPDKNGLSIRNLIRNTWAIEAKLNGIEIIFSIGIETETELHQINTTDAIIQENMQFHDILLANFVDRWENLLLKWWSNNYYHSSRCSQIPLMASMDSDAVLFGKNLKKLLDNTSDIFDGYLGCTILSKQPIIRDSSNRYYVNERQWPGKVFPDYCSGTIIIENVQACEKISYAIPQLGINYITGFRIFDVLTGPIAQTAGLQLRNLPGIQPWLPIDDICHSFIFVIHPIEADKLTDFLYYRQRCCEENDKYRKCPFDGIVKFNFILSH